MILPIRNEEMFIEESLNSLLEQDYDTGHCEIIVIDDHSNDRSSEIVQRYVDRDLPIRLLANTKTGTASARNKALETSRGEIVVNFSAHATATNSFLNTLVSKLLGSGPSIAGVGCRHETRSSDPLLSRIIGLALSTYLGGLGSTYSQPLSERYVTSTSFTAYRREIFKAIGTFDETLEPMGEDLDFNLRLREKGYRILFTPDALVYHHKDRSLSRFIRRMYLYGAARAIITTKHIRSFSLIYVGPSLLVMSLVVSLACLAVEGRMPLVLAVVSMVYALTCFGSALYSGSKWKLVLPLAAMYVITHVSYGVGYLVALPLALMRRMQKESNRQ